MTTIADLHRHLNAWLRWFRLRRAITWAARGLIAGLAISLALAWIVVFRGALLREEFALLVGSIVAVAAALACVAGYVWPAPRQKAAQLFDVRFGLRERVSTALELASAYERAYPPDLIHRQLEDAVAAARDVRPQAHLPVRVRRIELLAAAVLIAGLSLVWIGGESFFQAASQAKAVQQAIAQEVAQIEAIRQQIAADESLTDEQRRTLMEPLDEAQRRLQDSQTVEQATSVLTSTEQQLEALADSQSQQQAQGLREAGNSLSQEDGSPLEQFGENLAEGDYLAAAQDLQNIDVGSLPATERESLAQQLEQAAETLDATNPELAEQLREAADAARQGDAQAAQQALSQASQTLAQTGQQIAQAEAAREAAAQIGEGRQRVIQAGRGAQGSEGQTAQAGQSSQGDQAGQGSQSGQGDQSGQGQGTGDQPGQGADSTGAGRGEGNGEGLAGEAGADPIDQNNSAGNGGERAYEQIYAPDRLSGSAGEDVTLPDSGQTGDETTGQGNTSSDDPGQSLVPYVEVFAAYADAYRQAIDSGRVPVHLRALIRTYFSSLEP